MTDKATTHEDCAQMAALDPNHALLAPFEGTFLATVKMWLGPGEPMVSTGVMVNTFDLGGRFLAQHYTGDPNGGPFPAFEGRGYWGYNTATKKFEGFWIDNVSTMMQTEAGDVDEAGAVWTMFGEFTDPRSGATLRKRTIITLVDRNTHTMEMFFPTPDAGEAKSMEISYTRRQ